MPREVDKGVKIVLSVFLLGQVFPVAQTMMKLGLYNTLPGLGLVYTALFIPFSSWMLYG